ncbi:hypothetical protein FLONG3_8892 [Fusarium longipes]|uniref:T6SS Phospholipase effector Tle1-like catalytic domain-containing protein n=1 Tax=Fusarium longipes TaxID=694270 RepID=A0A395S2J6_9HYPO|nr:hypothetical protein FLONG3_8892 [Fusarium longipes]
MVYRRIVVCCDGTENDSIGTDNPLTNVARLARSLDTQIDDLGYIQVIHYQTGIATGTSNITNMYDAALGRGLHTDVKRAYNFICTNWSSRKDEIYLVGFSRGAYTVRCLAAFIDVIGLLTPYGLTHLNWLYNRWLDGTITPEELRNSFSEGSLALQHLDNIYCLRDVTKIKACVVWDTVSALGLPDSLSWLRPSRDKLAMVDNSVPGIVDNVFHALALNERRSLFKPNIWSDSSKSRQSPLNIKQCWFLGAHSDIGGGYEDIGLANISLIWMVAQLKTYTHIKISYYALQQLLLPQDISSSKGAERGSLSITGFKSSAPTLSAHGSSHIANYDP